MRIISLFAALKIYVSVTSAYNGPSRVVSSNCQPGNILIGPLGSASHILLCCEGRKVLLHFNDRMTFLSMNEYHCQRFDVITF